MAEFLGFLCMYMGRGGREHVAGDRTRLELMLSSCLSLQLAWIRVVWVTMPSLFYQLLTKNSFKNVYLNLFINIHISFRHVCIYISIHLS